MKKTLLLPAVGVSAGFDMLSADCVVDSTGLVVLSAGFDVLLAGCGGSTDFVVLSVGFDVLSFGFDIVS